MPPRLVPLANPRCSWLAVVIVCAALLAAASSPARASAIANPDTKPKNSPEIEQRQSAGHRRFGQALARVRPLLERYGYAAAALATLVESIGIPAPGQTLLIAGALEAADGGMNIGLLICATAAAAIAGNSLAYGIGRWGGRFVLQRLRVNPQRQHYLDELFARRGGMVVLFGRFVDGLRQLNGIVAGILRMPWTTFTVYNIAGAALWSASWGLGAYYFDRRIHGIAGFFHHHRRWFIAASAALVIALLAYRFRSNRQAEAR